MEMADFVLVRREVADDVAFRDLLMVDVEEELHVRAVDGLHQIGTLLGGHQSVASVIDFDVQRFINQRDASVFQQRRNAAARDGDVLKLLLLRHVIAQSADRHQNDLRAEQFGVADRFLHVRFELVMERRIHGAVAIDGTAAADRADFNAKLFALRANGFLVLPFSRAKILERMESIGGDLFDHFHVVQSAEPAAHDGQLDLHVRANFLNIIIYGHCLSP